MLEDINVLIRSAEDVIKAKMLTHDSISPGEFMNISKSLTSATSHLWKAHQKLLVATCKTDRFIRLKEDIRSHLSDLERAFLGVRTFCVK